MTNEELEAEIDSGSEGQVGTPDVITLETEVDAVAQEAAPYVAPEPSPEPVEAAPEVPSDTVQGPDIDTTPANELA